MNRKLLLAAIILFFIAAVVLFFYMNSLTFKIQKALWGKNCTVSVAVTSKYKIFKFNNKKVPLMSVFKYFVATPVLNKLEDEKKSLNDIIVVKEDMIDRNTYSPMLKKYSPPFKISIGELLQYMVSESDNNATDILINYIGGMQKLQMELRRYRLNNINIEADEKMMTKDIDTQYLNVATPLDVIETMQVFREDKTYSYILHPLQLYKAPLLLEEHKKFLDKIMIGATTGQDKLKAGLPKDAILGHKTGSSSRKPDGVKIADNDAGFVILPNGETYYIAVFVTESKMTDKENTALIAQISKIVYEYIVLKSRK